VSNASTIRRQVAGTQQLTLAALLGSTITTTETAFKLNDNGLTLTGGGVIPLAAGVTGLYAGTGQVIWIHAAGSITGGTASSTTLILALYQVPASLLPIADTLAGQQTFTSWNKIATSATGTLSSAVTAGNFSVDAYVQMDAQFNLDGWFQSQVFASTTGAKTATTAVKGLVGEADLNFALTAVLGGTEVGVSVNLDEFALALV
jgi:hypothetical protein